MKNIGEMFELGCRGGGKKKLPNDGVLVSVTGKDPERKSLSIAVGIDVMKACRWVIGDRATIDLDCAKSELTLRRVIPSDKSVVSWALAARAGGKSSLIPQGTTGAATIKLQSTPLMLKALGMDDATEAYVPEIVVTGAHGVTFPMRKQWTVIHRGGAK